MAHPYFVIASVFDDIERLVEATDTTTITRLGEESDDEIDNELPQPVFTVPLATVPDIISIASNKRTEGKYYIIIGELARGNALIADSKADVLTYVTTYKRTLSDTLGTVNIQDDTYFDFENSPLLDGEYTG